MSVLSHIEYNFIFVYFLSFYVCAYSTVRLLSESSFRLIRILHFDVLISLCVIECL